MFSNSLGSFLTGGGTYNEGDSAVVEELEGVGEADVSMAVIGVAQTDGLGDRVIKVVVVAGPGDQPTLVSTGACR